MLNHIRLKKIMRSINVLNVLLLTVIVSLAAYVLPPLLNVNVSYSLPAPKKVAQEKEEKPAVAQPPSTMDYVVIADQNVFNPERKIPAEKKEEQALPKPEFVLYGTLIADDTSLAYMEDKKSPRSTPGRGKRQTALRRGDTMSGFTLKEIEADKVVMIRGEERMMVYLIDPKSPKMRETSVAAPATLAPPQPSIPGQPPPATRPKASAPPAAQPAQPATPPAEQRTRGKEPVTPDTSDSARKAFIDFFRKGR